MLAFFSIFYFFIQLCDFFSNFRSLYFILLFLFVFPLLLLCYVSYPSKDSASSNVKPLGFDLSFAINFSFWPTVTISLKYYTTGSSLLQLILVALTVSKTALPELKTGSAALWSVLRIPTAYFFCTYLRQSMVTAERIMMPEKTNWRFVSTPRIVRE